MKNFLTSCECEIRCCEGYDNQYLNLSRTWQNNICDIKLNSNGKEAIKIKEIVIFKGEMPFEPTTKIYGEGYSKLTQYEGTIKEPKDIAKYSDRNHYKLPVVEGLFTVYNLMLFMPKEENNVLLSFSSCKRYSGEIRFNENYFEVVIDFEGLSIEPGKIMDLEEFMFISSENLEEAYNELAVRINFHHPMLEFPDNPTGWCSWYCYGPGVTQQNVYDNLEAISKKIPELKYIQIDDGYSAAEGDWLIPSRAFPSGVKELCLNIKEKGFEPAMWVAPFIAEINSVVFKEHPDWFIRDDDGTPLLSDKHTFGGWNHGPWYMLDGTHPGAQGYLHTVFKTMREDWQVKYFKLDANLWGAFPFGKHYDEKATRVDAYRAGMKAVREGAGEDSFILGCNAPMWPSLGTVHGMRVTGDIWRTWENISFCAKELFWRNWQNRRLWINDPDCIILENQEIAVIDASGEIVMQKDPVTEDEYMFHIATIFASGGMLLSGDNVTNLNDRKIEIIKKLIDAKNSQAVFDDTSFEIGRSMLNERLIICVFNWEETKKDISVQLDGKYIIKEFLTGEKIGEFANTFEVEALRPHCGKIYECVKY